MDGIDYKVNRKRIQRYMREMGIRVIYPGPNLSKRNRAQYVYPYLLRNVKPAHPNHTMDPNVKTRFFKFKATLGKVLMEAFAFPAEYSMR